MIRIHIVCGNQERELRIRLCCIILQRQQADGELKIGFQTDGGLELALGPVRIPQCGMDAHLPVDTRRKLIQNRFPVVLEFIILDYSTGMHQGVRNGFCPLVAVGVCVMQFQVHVIDSRTHRAEIQLHHQVVAALQMIPVVHDNVTRDIAPHAAVVLDATDIKLDIPFVFQVDTPTRCLRIVTPSNFVLLGCLLL